MAPSVTTETEVGIANLPNQRHKIVTQKGTNFTVMVVGESGLGKTTFVNTLLTLMIKAHRNPDERHAKQLAKTIEIEVTRAELEERKFFVRLAIVDTPGFGDYVDNRDNWVPIVEYIDNQYENYFRQERLPRRQNIEDNRVHVCLYFITPTGHTLKPLDIETMKHLSRRVNLVPVVGKADTLSPRDLEVFKKRVRKVIEANGIRVFQIFPEAADDEDAVRRSAELMEAMPFAIVASEQEVTNSSGERVRGRQYPWGVVEVENEAHSDFKKLRNLLVRSHMLDLITTTHDVHYERYRQSQMEAQGIESSISVSATGAATASSKGPAGKFKEEEENLRKRFTEQVKAEEARFKAWEQKLIGERDRLNKDLEAEHHFVRSLHEEVEQLMNARHK